MGKKGKAARRNRSKGQETRKSNGRPSPVVVPSTKDAPWADKVKKYREMLLLE